MSDATGTAERAPMPASTPAIPKSVLEIFESFRNLVCRNPSVMNHTYNSRSPEEHARMTHIYSCYV